MTTTIKEEYILNKLSDYPKRVNLVDEATKGNALELSKLLRKRIFAIYGAFLAEDGSGFNYEKAKTSEELKTYEVLTLSLNDIDVDDLVKSHTMVERMALFINLYNALIIHGKIKIGHPNSMEARNLFFQNVAYYIGKQIWTLDLIEHGILRCNAPKPEKGLLPEGDERLKLIMKTKDPRIHFALNCGAKSCPPVRFYDGDNLEKQLANAASAFVTSEDNLLVNVDSNTIKLSKILFWYGRDFAPTNEEMVQVLISYFPKEEKETVEKIKTVLNSGKMKLEFFDYDWGNNEAISSI